MKVGIFCNSEEEIDNMKIFALKKIVEGNENIEKIKKSCDYGFDIVTNRNEYIIRLAQESSRGCKFHEVYTYNIKDKRMLDILYFTLIPLDENDDLCWRFNSIKD